MLAFSMALYALLSGQYLLVFASFFVYLGAAQEAAAALGRSLTAGIPVRAAMVTEFHTLTHDSTIRDALNLTLATSQHDFPVMHGLQVVGLLSRQGLLRALAAEYQVEEVAILTTIHDPEARRRSYALFAEEFGLGR